MRPGCPAMSESPAATSFCEAVFDSIDDLIVVEDTALGPRLSGHPVAGSPVVRFYAAARLVVGAYSVGTLCAYDMKPRVISTKQVAELRALAAAVVEPLKKRASV